MNIFVEGTLPVAVKVLAGQETLKLKKVRLEALTVEQALKVQSGLKSDQYVGLAELSAQVTLIDENGDEYALDYDLLMSTTKQNLDYLTGLKVQLDAKEQAES
jgi:hypothetical protein